MTNRYQRQQQVPQLGASSAENLAKAKVLIVGAGGLGSPVSTLLAGAGVGQLTLIDHDIVSLSNLHRQTLFTEADIGQSKPVIAKQRLSQINSSINIEALPEALTPLNAEPLVMQHTVVVDAADSFFVSYLLSDLCYKHRIPLVSASVLQTNGYVGVFCGTDSAPAPSIRAIFPTPPLVAKNCSTAGVTGPSVGVIGSIQAQEVLKVIQQDQSQLLGKLLSLDLWDYRQNIVSFENAPEPVQSAKLISETSVDDHDTVIDVRTESEMSEQPRAINHLAIPVDQIQQRHQEIQADGRIVCVCKSGQRALNAAHQLLELGYQSVAVAL